MKEFFKNIDIGTIILGIFALMLVALGYLGHNNSQHRLHHKDLIKSNLIKKGYSDIEISTHIITGFSDIVPKGCVTIHYSIKDSSTDGVNDFNTSSFAYSIYDNNKARISSIRECNSNSKEF